MNRTRAVLAVALVGSMLLAGSGVAWASDDDHDSDDGHHSLGPGTRYVNMGDSFSAGSGVLPPAPGSAPACTQSARNWGHELAEDHDFRLTDVSCGGAETKDYTGSQFPGVAPQLDALSEATQLVTMTIGGNDSSVFISTVLACGTAAATTAGLGSPCKNIYGEKFTRQIETSTYPNLLAALRQVRAQAPNAKVAISGYLRILPSTRGCFPVMPVASGDVPYVNGIQDTLNDAVRRAAEATGVTFIDQSKNSAGHDACRPAGVRWVEPPVGMNYVPVHPNAAGERGMADRAAAVLHLGEPRRAT